MIFAGDVTGCNATQHNMTSVSTGGLGWSENVPLLPKSRSSASAGSDVLQKCFKKPQRVNSAPKVNRNELTLPEFSALDGRAALRLQAARVTTINKSIPLPATQEHTHEERKQTSSWQRDIINENSAERMGKREGGSRKIRRLQSMTGGDT